MGIETIIFASLTAISAVTKMMDAQDQAKTIKKNTEAAASATRLEGENVAKEKAKQIRQRAASQTSSFLSSGLTLEGTPEIVLGDTFATGLEDIDNIKRGYNTNIDNIIRSGNAQSKSVISKARSEVISDIAGSFAGSSFGGDMFSSASFGLKTGGQSFFDGGFGNVVGSLEGKYGPGF